MVTPELKCPTTNFTPSAANLLATETPCFGSETSSPKVSGDLLAEDAAGRVDVLDRLLGAVLELRAEGGVRAGDRPGDAELDLGLRRARQRHGEAERKAERGQLSSYASPLCIGLARLAGPDGPVRPPAGDLTPIPAKVSRITSDSQFGAAGRRSQFNGPARR